MTASANDLVRNATPTFATTLSAGITGPSDTSMSLSSVVGLPTGTGVTLVIDATNASGQSTPSVKETVTGVVSGSTITNLNRGQDGTTAQAHATGANVVMWITANLWNDFQAAFLHNHEQLHGNHTSLTDANGNAWVDQTATANAANRIGVKNNVTGSRPAVQAKGDPNLGLDFTDSNGHNIVSMLSTASAVNDVTIANAATGAAPVMQAVGSDSNIDLYIQGQGASGSPRFYGNYDGWNLDADTWVYVSATSFKIAGKNVTARFPTGTKIKVVQGGIAAYFFVTGAAFSTDTTVTINAGSDYSLSNTAITSPSYSYETCPQGFPSWFNYSPTLAGLTSVGTGSIVARFAMQGKTVLAQCKISLGTGFAWTGTAFIGLPVQSSGLFAVAEGNFGNSSAWLAHAGSDMFPAIVLWVSNTTIGFRYHRYNSTPNADEAPSGTNVTNTVPFTWAASDWLQWATTYEAA